MARPGYSGEIDPDHLEEVLVGLEEIARGDIATAHEIEAAFRRFET